MLKRFLNGLIFGAGFGIAFVGIWAISIYFILPKILENKIESEVLVSRDTKLTKPPPINSSNRFLGSPAIHSSGFDNEGDLSPGPGKIVGSAEINGQPLAGLKLRLALNNSVMSQWTSTDLEGKYIINIPYGKYIIDGFELDQTSANKVLPGKILHPQSPHSSSAFEVSDGSDGHGINFKFIDPVIKKFVKNKYSSNEKIILEWQPYTGAALYSIQIYEKSEPYAWSNNTLFKHQEMPTVSEPNINLSEYNLALKPGNFYYVDIYARDKEMGLLSESFRNYSGYDFEIIE